MYNDQAFDKITQIVKDKGGITFKYDQFPYIWHEYAGSGYAVSLPGAEVRIGDTSSLFYTILEAYGKLNELRKDQWLGIWYDRDNGHIYFDVSIIKTHYGDALRLAYDHKQKAIWSFNDNQVIELRDL